jgi:hypothetical protein
VIAGLGVSSKPGTRLPRSVATSYPEVARLLENPSPPVVLELRGIGRQRLSNERGSPDIDFEIEEFRVMQEHRGVNSPTAFRIRDVTAADVVAIHDLSEWPSEEIHDSFWRPEPAKVNEVRRSVNEWLTGQQRA